MAEDAVLTLNAGSSSLKFALFGAADSGRRLLDGAVHEIGRPGAHLTVRDRRARQVADIPGTFATHAEALTRVLETVGDTGRRWQIRAVGHRLAQGGPGCDCPKRVTPTLVAKLKRLVHLAPLHLPANIAGIEAVLAQRPDIPQVACFDTAFHHGLPGIARMTGLPPEVGDGDLRRYGYHGLSCEYILGALAADGVAVARERIIIAHLGSGASLSAVKDGHSVETTMGFSTLSGVPMGTRSGDIDPGLLLHLLLEKGLPPERLQTLLYNGSGLAGLSGISGDMRTLLDRPEERAARAIDYFCYQVRKQIGALSAVLGGLDRLVFTGGIGASAPRVRARICTGLGHLGIALDGGANARDALRLSRPGAAKAVEARVTDEEAMIAGHVRDRLHDRRPLCEAAG